MVSIVSEKIKQGRAIEIRENYLKLDGERRLLCVSDIKAHVSRRQQAMKSSRMSSWPGNGKMLRDI